MPAGRRQLIAFAAVAALAASAAGPQVAAASVTHPVSVVSANLQGGAGTLQSAASKASQLARSVAMSLIALALAIAGTILVFRRDFKEAVGVFVVGGIAVLLATPIGLSLIRSTVSSLFGGA